MTDKEKLKLTAKLRRIIKKEFGVGKGCRDFSPNCGACMGNALHGYLMWYEMLLENDLEIEDQVRYHKK